MKRHLLNVAAVNLLLFAAGLIALELLFGGWLKDNAFERLNVVRDRTVVYDLNGIYESPTGQAVYRRDRYGLRGFYRSPDSITILTVGGSATDQRFITEGETWQDRMRSNWAQRGRDVTVVNAGVDGQSTYGHLKNFSWWFPGIPNLRPRFVLCYVGVNDLFGNVGTIWDAIDLPETALDTLPAEERAAASAGTSSAWAALRRQVEEKSALFYLLRTVTGIERAYRVKLNHARGFRRRPHNWTDALKIEDHRSIVARDLADYAARLRLLLRAIHALGARPIIVTQAAHYYLKDGDRLLGFNDPGFMFKGREVLGVDIHHFLRLFSQTALDVCRNDHACIPIDLFEELQFETGDFYDNSHLTPNGALKMADYLVQKLDPLIAAAL